jgi:hypothetical protein
VLEFDKDVVISPLGVTSARIARNALSLPTVTLEGAGIYRVECRENDDRTYDVTTSLHTPVAHSAAFRSMKTAFRFGNAILYRNQAGPVGAPPDFTGTGSYRVTNTMVEDGVYDALLIYESGDLNGRHLFQNLESILARGWEMIYRDSPVSIAVPAGADGKLYRVNQDITDDGLYHGSLFYEAGRLSETISQVASGGLAYALANNFVNAPDTLSPGHYQQGMTVAFRREVNKYGLYDGVYNALYSTAQCFYETWPADSGEAFRYQYMNWREYPAEVVAGLPNNRRNTISCVLQNDMTYNVDITSWPAGASGATFDGRDDFYYSEFGVIKLEARDVLTNGFLFGQRGFYHRVEYFDNEEDAHEFLAQGWEPKISTLGGKWRVDVIYGIYDLPASSGLWIVNSTKGLYKPSMRPGVPQPASSAFPWPFPTS